MTMMEPMSDWFELVPKLLVGIADNFECNHTFDDMQLSRYPRLRLVESNRDSKFKLYFEQMCRNFNIEPQTTGAWNPQPNATLEKIHQALLENYLRTFELDDAGIDEVHA